MSLKLSICPIGCNKYFLANATNSRLVQQFLILNVIIAGPHLRVTEFVKMTSRIIYLQIHNRLILRYRVSFPSDVNSGLRLKC